ncbi:MAG: phosphopantetheinyl transferase, partial [Deltaproteobacteria bacterium]|nr:phosphopantetheinyl transferase [Deltaproteobacteria bacterium]MBW2534609.1 phosphopantetheinyl transferase [Deltaproteobacteria bacterium]
MGEVPAGDEWLGPDEARVAGALRFPKRRGDWRLGRWTAKRAAAASGWAVPPDAQILAAADGAPQVVSSGAPLPWSISISHSHGLAI